MFNFWHGELPNPSKQKELDELLQDNELEQRIERLERQVRTLENEIIELRVRVANAEVGE